MAIASVGVNKQEHYKDVLLDQVKKEIKKDNMMPSFNLGLGQS